MNDPLLDLLYDLTGWTQQSVTSPTQDDLPIWLWAGGEVMFFQIVPAQLSTMTFWKRATVPQPPRRYTEHELERKLCLDMWRGRSLDFAEHQWSDLPQDWIDGWMAARKVSKIQATNHST